ncbi:MAG: DUF4349 domain-containing protein [Spirochaetaceae bacterium]
MKVFDRGELSPVPAVFALILAGVFVFLGSCGNGDIAGFGSRKGEAQPKVSASRSGAAMEQFAAESAPMATESTPMVKQDSADSTEPTEVPQDGERKLVSTGSMDLVVDNLDKAESELRLSVKEMGGYIASTNRRRDSFSMTVKIPSEKFDGFIEESEELGEVDSKQTNVQDVTDQFYDLEHRISNKEILLERFRSYLDKAEEIEDILRVERELNDTLTELESLEGSFTHLSHRISFSTLHINARLPSYASDHGPLPSLRDGLTEFGYTVVKVFYSIFFLVLGIVVFGTPLVLGAGLLYWLAFGKVGVVRRFFRRLRPERSASEKRRVLGKAGTVSKSRSAAASSRRKRSL